MTKDLLNKFKSMGGNFAVIAKYAEDMRTPEDTKSSSGERIARLYDFYQNYNGSVPQVFENTGPSLSVTRASRHRLPADCGVCCRGYETAN